MTQNEINNVLSNNKDKKLKSVIILSKTREKSIEVGKLILSLGKYDFFIFEKLNSKIIEKDFLVIEMKKKLMPNIVFYEDLAMKLNSLQNQELVKEK